MSKWVGLAIELMGGVAGIMLGVVIVMWGQRRGWF